jgi:CrcB protein
MRLWLIGLAGAAGALCRYGIGTAVGAVAFPWTTLSINLVGSFLLGLLVRSGVGTLGTDVRIALGTGFLGAFTTFSTFSVEAMTLVRDGRPAAAGAYVAVSVAAGLAAAAAGYGLGSVLS